MCFFWYQHSIFNDTQPYSTSNSKPQNHLQTTNTATEPSNSTYIRLLKASYYEPQPMAQERFVE